MSLLGFVVADDDDLLWLEPRVCLLSSNQTQQEHAINRENL